MNSISGVPVLMYHRLAADPAPGQGQEAVYWVSPLRFREQMECLRQAVEVVSLDEIVGTNALRGGASRVAITFDDGCASDFEIAYPTLARNGHTATFFINTATVGQNGFVRWQQLQEMQRGGMVIGSHAHHHVGLAYLPIAQGRVQLERSKAILEDHLGTAIQHFSAPFGSLSHAMTTAAFQAGYSVVCTSRPWTATLGRPVIPRLAVYAATTTEQFQKLIDRDLYAYVARLCSFGAKACVKRVLRPRILQTCAPASAL